MQKNLVLNQVTLCADGSIGLQWLKQIIDDDGSVIFNEPHRSIVDFDGDANAQLDAVFAHLDQMKFKTTNPMRQRMKRIVNAVDAIGQGDTEITSARQAKIDAKAAALAAQVAATDAKVK